MCVCVCACVSLWITVAVYVHVGHLIMKHFLKHRQTFFDRSLDEMMDMGLTGYGHSLDYIEGLVYMCGGVSMFGNGGGMDTCSVGSIGSDGGEQRGGGWGGMGG